MVELLAPAGTKEALIAAVESGANAVYLAGSAFGARAYASNFDEEGLRWAVHFAHLRDVRINVTVNTIVSDSELPALRDYLRFLADIGVDAILVQDLGVAKLAHDTVPDLPLHASTQMSVHNLAGVKALAALGFTRVVLAREVSLADIRTICAASPIEIEVFMHGAICICYSGQCLMSSMIGGRSGNRGRCAQPCRLPYTLVDENGQDVLGDKAGQYLLSPRDCNTIDVLPELLAAGVASLKIEGRMKRPEYVATVVRTYREAIDRYDAGEGYAVRQEQRDSLAQIFNRDFTTGFLLGHEGKAMMSDRRPNNRGLLVGRVLQADWNRGTVQVKLSNRLAQGDQIDFWVKVGGRVTATIDTMTDAKGRSITEAASGDTVTFAIEGHVHPHDRVFKVFDAQLMAKAREAYQTGAPVRRIPIRAEVTAAVGAPLRIVLTDEHGDVGEGATDFIGEPARKRPLSEETIQKQVSRLGTSVYELTELTCHIDGAVMVPMSEINEARRRAVEMLDTQRLARFAASLGHGHADGWQDTQQRHRITKTASLMVTVENLAQAKAAVEAGADGLLFGGESYARRMLHAKDYAEVWAYAKEQDVRLDYNTPRIVRMQDEQRFRDLLEAWKSCPPEAVHVHNLSELAIVRDTTDFALHADYSLISYNQLTLAFLRDYGVAEATLSPELNAGQIKEIAPHSPLPLTCIGYGRLELMVSEYCVTGSFLGGLGEGREMQCSRPCVGRHFALRDRKEAKFPLVMDQFCHMHVLNSRTLSMLPHAMKFRRNGIRTVRIEARDMDIAAIRHIVTAWRKAEQMPLEPDEAQEAWLHEQEGREVTRGHYFRGVL